jgi:N-succinyldiaminopimelate aminotransferase
MTTLAQRTGAINLGQGFPDTDGPPEVVEAAVAALRARLQPVPAWGGIPSLRRRSRATSGASTASRSTRTARSWSRSGHRGDRVAAARPVRGGRRGHRLEPYYDSYAACVAMADAMLRPVTLRPRASGSTRPSWRRGHPRTRLILLNTPHNPTGAC